ncbi:MAG: mersacidin/lichenicidin family type 2 lantibiotic [Pirellulales bacterium]|jgi:mersacidin/lichenicidin family type 2 lantibiotic|nr:mersacidin/lichenicidin family type 2 lantibiotic [Pirellulales bacterium]
MSRLDILRAWKDAAYRNSLSAAERAQLPASPAGAVELTAAEAATIDGKLSVAICSGCHGCTKSFNSFMTRINPAPLYRF